MVLNSFERGQTLLEAVIALSVLVVTLAAIAISIVTSLNNAIFLKDQNLANKYAQEGIEYMRNLRATNYSLYKENTTPGSNWCLDSSFNFSQLPCFVNVGSFKREVRFDSGDECGENGIEAIVTVRWSSGRCPTSDTYCHKSQVSTCFNNYLLEPTPKL